MKKLVLLLLVVFMTHNALASYDIKLTDDNSYSSSYDIVDEDNKFVELVSIDSRYTEFEIPATVAVDGEEYAVVEIAEKAFYNNTRITKVVLPSTVTIIDDNAFYGCTALKDVELSTTLTTIGAHAFFNCAFENIDLPETLTQIDTYAFNACKNLTEITIPAKITEIQPYVFCACTNLKTVNLSAGIEVIDNYAFSSCSNINTFNVDALTPPTIGTNSLACKPTTATVNVPDEVAWNYYKSDWATYFKIGNELSFTDGTYNYSVTSQSDKTVEVTGFTGEYIIIDNIIDEVAYDDELTFTITSVAEDLFSNVVLWVPAVEDYEDIADLNLFSDVKKNPDYYIDGVYYNIIENDLKCNTVQLEVTAGPNAYTGDIIIPKTVDLGDEDGTIGMVFSFSANAFSNCSELTSITLESIVPIENSDALLQVPEGCTIIVENTESRNYYEQLFANTDIVVTIKSITATKNIITDKIEIARYNLSGNRISAPTKGINIVVFSDGSSKKEIVK